MWTTGKIIGSGKVEREQLPRSTPTALPGSGFEHISTIIEKVVNDMRVKLIGSKGTALELSRTTWEAAIQAASAEGWRWNTNINSEHILHKADSNSLSKALQKAGRNGSGERFIYLADFLLGNAITIEQKEKTG
jgi:hypothetical protein